MYSYLKVSYYGKVKKKVRKNRKAPIFWIMESWKKKLKIFFDSHSTFDIVHFQLVTKHTDFTPFPF